MKINRLLRAAEQFIAVVEVGLGGRFPSDTDLGKEALSRRALFRQDLIPAVPVIPDRGRADEDLRPAGQAGQGPGQEARAFDAALPDAGLLCRRPPPAGDAFPGQVDGGLDAL